MGSSTMKEEIQRISQKLGIEINFDADADLTKLRKGQPLRLNELRALPDGTPIFVQYKEYGSRGYRINHAMRIRLSGDSWVLEDGSSFAAEFSPERDTKDSDSCTTDCCGEGEMRLYCAVK